MRHIARISRHYDRLAEMLAGAEPAFLEIHVPAISGWTIGEQLDHTLQVANKISALLLKKQLTESPGVNMRGRFVLTSGFIPRGKAQAPAHVLPKKREREELEAAVERAREQLGLLAADGGYLKSPHRYFEHPFLGGLTPAQSLRFIEVHTRHHLKIVDEILSAAPRIG